MKWRRPSTQIYIGDLLTCSKSLVSKSWWTNFGDKILSYVRKYNGFVKFLHRYFLLGLFLKRYQLSSRSSLPRIKWKILNFDAPATNFCLECLLNSWPIMQDDLEYWKSLRVVIKLTNYRYQTLFCIRVWLLLAWFQKYYGAPPRFSFTRFFVWWRWCDLWQAGLLPSPHYLARGDICSLVVHLLDILLISHDCQNTASPIIPLLFDKRGKVQTKTKINCVSKGDNSSQLAGRFNEKH